MQIISYLHCHSSTYVCEVCIQQQEEREREREREGEGGRKTRVHLAITYSSMNVHRLYSVCV